jgi:hypothetical protein
VEDSFGGKNPTKWPFDRSFPESPTPRPSDAIFEGSPFFRRFFGVAGST